MAHIKLQFIMTHLANAGDVTQRAGGLPEAGPDTRAQHDRFKAICAHFPGVKTSIGASAAVFLGKEFQQDMVRMGGIFHGQAQFDADNNPLEPVLTLEAHIAASPQEASSSDQGSPEALVSIGFGDGLSSRAAGLQYNAHMLVNGLYKARVLEAPSKDFTRIDVSGIPSEHLQPGTPVTVIGDSITADHLGQMYGTNASETQTKLTDRVHMQILDKCQPPHADATRASDNLWDVDAGPSVRSTSLRHLAIENQRSARLGRDAAGAVATLDLGALRRNLRVLLSQHEGKMPRVMLPPTEQRQSTIRCAKVLIEEGIRDLCVTSVPQAVLLREALRVEVPELFGKIFIHVIGDVKAYDRQWLLHHHAQRATRKVSMKGILEWKNEAWMPKPYAKQEVLDLPNSMPLQPDLLNLLHWGAGAVDQIGGMLLEPVLKLESNIAQVRKLKPGDAIGYGLNYKVDAPMMVATLPIGYADGVPRVAGGNRPGKPPTQAYVLVNGKYKAPLVGATSMDQTTINVTGLPAEALRPETPVTVIGNGIGVTEFAQMYGTDPGDTPAKLTGRVYKVVVDEESRRR